MVRTKTFRRKLFDLHSWLGFQLAIFMTLVVASGTFAVIADEIDWLVHPELRVTEGERVRSWGAIERSVRDFAPDHILTALGQHEGSSFAYKAHLIDAWGQGYFLYVDPYTGEITGRTSTLTVQRFLRDLHRYLFMPSVIGLPLVTTMAVVLLISLYTGLKTARNWRTLATRVRLNKGTRVAWGDFHKFSGLWGSWFFVLIIATSFWYFAELVTAVSGERFEPERPGISQTRAATLGYSVQLADADVLVAAAQQAMPGFRPDRIEFATRPGLAATVLGRHQDVLVRSRANRVFLDPVDASIIKVQRSTDIGWVAYLNELADPLHFGSFGGLASKLVWFLFGLSMLSLTLSGVWLTWQRIRTRSPTLAHWATLPLVLTVAVLAVPYVERHVGDRRFADFVLLTGQATDHIAVSLALEKAPAGNLSGRFRLLVQAADERVNLSEVRVATAHAMPIGAVTLPVRTMGRSTAVSGTLPVAGLPEVQAFDLTLTFTSGQALPVRLPWSRPELGPCLDSACQASASTSAQPRVERFLQ